MARLSKLQGSACSLVSIERLQKQHKQTGFFLFISQKGCGACSPTRNLIKKEVSGIPCVEIPAEQAACNNLAAKLHVDKTPTILYYSPSSKKGRRVKWERRTKEQVRQDLQKIVTKNQRKK